MGHTIYESTISLDNICISFLITKFKEPKLRYRNKYFYKLELCFFINPKRHK